MQLAAPRDRASSPSAPDPAKRSATASPSKLPRRLVNMENSASRVRSAVGRVVSPLGASIERPRHWPAIRSEEHTSELQSLMRISYAVCCLKKKTKHHKNDTTTITKSATAHNTDY